MTTNIYGLFDENGRIRYVGKTVHPVEVRLAQHVRTAKRGVRTHKECWIRSLLSAGKRPTVQIIETSDGDGSLEESWWIAQFRRVGIELTNLTDGGDGVHGLREESRQKMRAAQLGRKHSAETRQKMSAAHTGRKHSAATLQKMCVASSGRTHSAEAKRKISVANSLRQVSSETRKKLSAANAGRVRSAETRQKMSAAKTAWHAARRSQAEMVTAHN